MENNSQTYLEKTLKYLLFVTTLTPLVVTHSTLFPFIAGKIFFFRALIEVALILFVIYLFTNRHLCKSVFTSVCIRALRNPLAIFLSLFLLSLILSTVFAESPYRAFWGDIERGEGLFGMLHFFAFLVMTVLIFDKRDWIKYLKATLVVGFIVIFYAILQSFKLTGFPFMPIPLNSSRVESFIGNSAFLAAYLILLIPIATIVFSKVYKSKLWSCLSLAVIFLAPITIFLTGTRGAILGLGAGIFFLLFYFAFKKIRIDTDDKNAQIDTDKKNPYKSAIDNQHISARIPARRSLGEGGSINPRLIKRISIALLILLIAFSGTFFFTRDADIWQKIPGFNRLAQTAAFDINDPSTQTRLMTWGVSWEAFKDKPIIGWGVENYLPAYSMHFNPDYALYGETWLDRAHNKIFDILVMQGIFGFIAYLGIFISVFYLLFKEARINTDKEDPYKSVKSVSSVLIVAAIIAYFVQNLFLFDDFSMYLLLFALLGLLTNATVETRCNQTVADSPSRRNKLLLPGLLLIPALLFSLVYYNYIPYLQAKTAAEVELRFKTKERSDVLEALAKEQDGLIKSMARIFSPYNFAQATFRAHIADYYYQAYPEVYKMPVFDPLFNTLSGALREVAEKEPSYDPRYYLRQALIFNTKADDKEEFYERAEESARKALELSPGRQEIYYSLAVALAGQGKNEEMLKVMYSAVELSPGVARAHFHLAIIYSALGDRENVARVLAKAEELDPNLSSFTSRDINNFSIMYKELGMFDKVADLVIKSFDGKNSGGFGQDAYEIAMYYFITVRDSKNFIRVAEFMRDRYYYIYEHREEDLEVVIDLAKRENWNILESLVEIR